VSERPSIRAQLARGFDPAELRRIKRLWVRHSIAEDRRDIDGLIWFDRGFVSIQALTPATHLRPAALTTNELRRCAAQRHA
jgi:hypothetical protein